jgi:hypothetical protein
MSKRLLDDVIDVDVYDKQRRMKVKLNYGQELWKFQVDSTNAAISQLKTADLLMMRYTFPGFEHYIKSFSERSEDHLRILLSTIRAPNIHSCNKYGIGPRVGTISPVTCARPPWLYDYVKNNCCQEAIDEMEGGFISGAGVMGFYNAFKKFEQSGEFMLIDFSIFMTAYYRMRLILNINPYPLFEWDKELYYKMEMNDWTIAGLFNGIAIRPGGETSETVTVSSVYRFSISPFTIQQLEDLRKKYNRGKMKTFDDFPTMPIAIAAKSEPKRKGDDRTKVRLVNLVSNLKVALDKYFVKSYHDQFYKSRVVGIGHSWRSGGAYCLYRNMEAEIPNKWFYVTLDISRLDKNMREQMIAFLSYDHAQYIPQTDRNKYFSRCLSAMTAVRHLIWYGTSRDRPHVVNLVQGSLASGEYQTSSIDTKCALMLNLCFDEWIYRKIDSKKDMKFSYFGTTYTVRFSQYSSLEWREQFVIKRTDIGNGERVIERPYAPMVDYGDDLFRAWSTKFSSLLLYKHSGKVWPLLYMWFIKTFFCLEAKKEEVDVYEWQDNISPVLTLIDQHDNIIRPGPKYLQRRFIRVKISGQNQILPWRVTQDYYLKATVRSARSFEDPVIYFSVLLGLKFDTAGTNRTAFKFLDGLERELLKYHPYVRDDLISRLKIKGWGERHKIGERLKKMGFDDFNVITLRLNSYVGLIQLFCAHDYEAVYRKWLLS